jgi:endonuclease YncB( thermonuclease family)
VLAVAIAAALAVAPGATATADRDCGDFATQAAAQEFFIDAGGPASDPHRLDSDGDGVACESRPCPCSTAGAGEGRPEPQSERLRGRVLKAVDGDTIRVRSAQRGNRVISVRLLGIDTPEKYGGRECLATRASDFTNRLLKGRRVKLTTDPSQDRRDRYGRLLAYVTRSSRTVQVAILSRGLARVYAPDGAFRRIGRFRKAQSKARDGGRGAWSACGGDFHKPL